MAEPASSADLDGFRLVVQPGDGVVARFPGVVLVVRTLRDAQRAVAATLLDLCEEAAHSGTPGSGAAPGRRLLRRLAGLLADAEPDEVPDFCVLGAASGRVAALVHGDVDLVATGGRQQRLSGAESATWVDRLLDADVGELSVAATGAPAGQAPPWLDLRAGVVPGGGAVLVRVDAAVASPAAAAHPPSTVDTPAGSPVVTPSGTTMPPPLEPLESGVDVAPGPPEEPVDAPTFEAVLLVDAADDEPPRQPLRLDTAMTELVGAVVEADEAHAPEVEGIVCSRGHFNDPSAVYCSACGISLAQRTHEFVSGPRPPLGLLVFDDGTTYTLDGDYVLGRQPDRDESVQAGSARPLQVDDPDGAVSRVHAEIRLNGWDVTIADRGSANGTYLAPPESPIWTPLAPREPARLAPGTRVQLGRRTFVFDSYHKV